jgi:hypothetical protein
MEQPVNARLDHLLEKLEDAADDLEQRGEPVPRRIFEIANAVRGARARGDDVTPHIIDGFEAELCRLSREQHESHIRKPRELRKE